MKTLTALILVCISATASAQFSPTQDRKGFIGGYFRGANLDVTNTTFYTASGVAFAAIDQYAGVTLSDTNGVTKFLFDGFDSTLSLMDKLGTVRLDVDAANKLHINNPIITGTLTGSILNATNLPVSGLNTNGGTPGQVATAQANGTVTWSNAPAGSGSSVTFNPNQFGSSSIGTNLLSGVLLTNAVNRIADETIFVTDSSGAGNPLLSWDSDNGDIRVHANLVVRDGFYGHGGNLTNLNASAITSGTFTGNGRGITNNAIGTWTSGTYGTIVANGIAQAVGVSAPLAGHGAASSQTNIAFNLFRSPFRCYLSNFCVGFNNGSGSSHAGTNYLVSIVTNGVIASQSTSLLTNGASTVVAFSYVTNTAFSINVEAGTAVAFYLQNTNAAHTPSFQALIWTVGVYAR